MAINDDISIAVNGDIRYTGTTANYTVLELHRFAQQLADDAQAVTTSLDYMDISFPTPTDKTYDTIIVLNAPYNIDDALAEHLYGGSIEQDGGDTLYAGLKVVGSVNTALTQVQVIQDNALYDTDSPFWGTQVSPYNGAGTTLFRILVKVRESGYDIDGQRIRLRAAHWFDTFSNFDVQLGVGESVGAISTGSDPQNTTAEATVGAWTGGDIPTNVEGYQLIDIDDGNGDQPYYSQWTYNTNSLLMKAIWEWGKYITRTATAETIHTVDGELFRGITDYYAFDGGGTTLTEDEIVAWGTGITYDTLAGGTFTEGYYVTIGSSGAAGRVGYDNGTVQMTVALEDTSITLVTADVITEYNPSTGVATGVTAAINVTIVDNDKEGGTALLLATTGTATGSHWLMTQTGLSPVDNLPIIGTTSENEVTVNGTVTLGTIYPVFLGAYTGSLIGGYGVGFDPADLVSGDTVQDLDGDTNSAPTNVVYILSGLVSGEDYVLIMDKDVGNDFDFAEMTLATTLNGAAETQIDVGAGNVPLDAPATGVVRVTLDDGRHRRVAYTSRDTQYFTIASSDWQDPDDATAGVGVSMAFVDKLATGSSEQFTLKYNADRTLWQRRRDGGELGDGIPTKTWEQQGNLTINGGSAIAARLTDA